MPTGQTVILQERLDGSLWASAEGLCVPVGAAPADAGRLRARRLAPPSDRDLPVRRTTLPDAHMSLVPEPPGEIVRRPRPDHPWRR